MQDWNVVATIRERGFREAMRILSEFGQTERTDYFNVAVVRVEDPALFAPDFEVFMEGFPAAMDYVARAVPVFETFTFIGVDEFRALAEETALLFLPVLAGKAFHVRLRRRGFKGILRTPEVERFLDEALLTAMEATGSAGRLAFDAAEAVLDAEMVGNRCGMSVWTREEIARYPFLGLA